MNGDPRVLVVAPYLGEFGWELMNWQGRVRRLLMDQTHPRVVLCASPDRRPLYANAAADGRFLFCPVHVDAPGIASEDHRIDARGNRHDPERLRLLTCDAARRACEHYGIDLAHAEFLTPDYRGTLWPTDRADQWFSELRQSSPLETDILLVPRTRKSATERNQPASWWEELAARLIREGLSVEVYMAPLSNAIRQLSRARLAIGASTGGLHLASLCRCPHFVWGSGADDRWTALKFSNRQRYETIWNPFGTPCRYDECGWQPTVHYILKKSLGALAEIGLPRGRATPAWSWNPKWRIKRRIARLLDDRRGILPWPWTVRQFVREHVV
ncbi:MAG TPA: hypothetical protein VJZ71_11730 [Phycisphaerae bacterium]|nr:hypothetical protein [Phycisphaerae bacterium]